MQQLFPDRMPNQASNFDSCDFCSGFYFFRHYLDRLHQYSRPDETVALENLTDLLAHFLGISLPEIATGTKGSSAS